MSDLCPIEQRLSKPLGLGLGLALVLLGIGLMMKPGVESAYIGIGLILYSVICIFGSVRGGSYE